MGRSRLQEAVTTELAWAFGGMTTPDLSPAPAELEDWLARHVSGYAGPGHLKKFSFGQSNPTFQLNSPSGNYVVRRKPIGALLEKAHAIDREFFVLKSLAPSDVPLPRVYAYCDDASVLGAPFYVMAYVTGRIFYDQTLPGLAPDERGLIFDGMNDVVARLHRLEPKTFGLESYGRPSGFLNRQISLWTRQYQQSSPEPIAAMEQLIDWLPRHVPDEQPVRVFHGDLRLDNMIFHPQKPEVIAILDWELSTLGDPLADFAYNAMIWRIPPDLFRGLHGLPLSRLGIPDETAYVEQYCRRTARHGIPGWPFYLAFGLFRVAAILQGVAHRARLGIASATDAAVVGASAASLAELGWSCTASKPLE